MLQLMIYAFVSVATATAPGQDPPATNPDAKVIADFQARVKDYAKLHQKLESTLPPQPTEATSEKLAEHQQALERLMSRARSGAKRGDIFTDSIRPYFRRQIARALEGPDGRIVRQSITDEDTRAVRLMINGRYPDGIPLSSVPPQILLLLPRLPDELQYHFVGDRLILVDVHANIVVDFIEKAFGR
jgi:hypothetical protein